MSTETTERHIDATEMHRTAALMRERSKAAMQGRWFVADAGYGNVRAPIAHDEDGAAVADTLMDADATHIASWPPLVTEPVADLLDTIARDVGTSSLAYHAAAAVVRAYLGESA